MYGPNESGRDRDVMYYITVYNEPMKQPAEPENVDVEGIIKGIYKVDDLEGDGPTVKLLASGVGVPWARDARRILREDWGVNAAVYSVTSWNELRRDGLAADEHNYLKPEEEPKKAYVTSVLEQIDGPTIATSDFEQLVQDQIREWVPGEYYTLGANGFGFSDTRAAARRHLKIDAESMVVRTLQALADAGQMDRSVVKQAIDKYDLFNPNAGTSGATGGDA